MKYACPLARFRYSPNPNFFIEMDREQLAADIKRKILAALNLKGVSPEDIETDADLFGDDGLGLDSVDALELVVMTEREYGVSIDESTDTKKIFASVGALADYILADKK